MRDRTSDTLEDELDNIRQGIYEKIKDMTAEEEVAYFIAQSEPLYREFNIRRSNLQPAVPHKKRVAMTV